MRTFHEELDGLRHADRRQISIGVRGSQRRNSQYSFSVEHEPLSTCGEDPHTRARAADLLYEVGNRIQHVLTVVDHQQQLLRPEELRQRLRHALARAGTHPEHRGERIDHVVGITDRRQLDQPGTLTEPGQRIRGDLQCQPGLADATDPRQRHHSTVAQSARPCG